MVLGVLASPASLTMELVSLKRFNHSGCRWPEKPPDPRNIESKPRAFVVPYTEAPLDLCSDAKQPIQKPNRDSDKWAARSSANIWPTYTADQWRVRDGRGGHMTSPPYAQGLWRGRSMVQSTSSAAMPAVFRKPIDAAWVTAAPRAGRLQLRALRDRAVKVHQTAPTNLSLDILHPTSKGRIAARARAQVRPSGAWAW